MANYIINPELYIGETGKKLKDLKTLYDSINSLSNRLITLENVSKNNGYCCIGWYGDDIYVNTNTDWQQVIIKIPHLEYNDNTTLFELIDGGIKVKKDGVYLVSSTVNSGGGGSAMIYTTRYGYTSPIDGSDNGMVNYNSGPYIAISLNAGDIIYAAMRFAYSGSHLIRICRSGLNVIRISHI